MFCKECGHEINEKAIMCVHCGVPTKEEPKKEINNQTIVNVHNSGGDDSSSYARTALWLGLFSLFCGITGPFALIYGILAVQDIHRHPEKGGMGSAVFAIIIGGLTSLVVFCAMVNAMNS